MLLLTQAEAKRLIVDLGLSGEEIDTEGDRLFIHLALFWLAVPGVEMPPEFDSPREEHPFYRPVLRRAGEVLTMREGHA